MPYGRQEIGRARIQGCRKKYENDKDAEPRLAKKVREAESASGPIPMAANPQVNQAESLQLVKWVLSLK